MVTTHRRHKADGNLASTSHNLTLVDYKKLENAIEIALCLYCGQEIADNYRFIALINMGK